MEFIQKNTHVNNINSQEDRVCEFNTDGVRTVAVFDGHAGKDISNALANGFDIGFPTQIIESVPSFNRFIVDRLNEIEDQTNIDQVKKVITESFLEYDKKMSRKFFFSRQGSTGTILIIFNSRAYIAYLGDSSCMVMRDRQLYIKTSDHKAICNEEERQRLEELNIVITKSNDIEVLNDTDIKVVDGVYHQFSSPLAISKAFGHFDYKFNLNGDEDRYKSDSPMSVIPTILDFEIDPNHDYKFIMGTDGLWDMMPKEGSDQIFLRLIDESNESIAKTICDYADSKWKQPWNVHQKDGSVIEYTMGFGQWDDVAVAYISIPISSGE